MVVTWDSKLIRIEASDASDVFYHIKQKRFGNEINLYWDCGNMDTDF